MRYLLILLLFLLSFCSLIKKPAAVVTGDPVATEAAAKILRQGGTAADAFITALLVLTNVEPSACGLGGGFFAIYYDAESEQVYALDAREEQPRNLRTDAFWDYSRTQPKQGWQRSLPSIGVPGAADGLEVLFQEFSKLDRQVLIEPAVEIAEQGFTVSEYFYNKLEKYSDHHPWQGYKVGDKFINQDYAKALRSLANDGFNSFYNGALAQAIDSLSPYIDKQDLQNYRAVFRKPAVYNYGDKQIYSMPSPSSGALTLYRIFDFVVAGMDEYKAIDWAYKLRDKYFGDKDFTSCKVREDALETELVLADSFNQERGTTHIAISDQYGNLISATATIQSGFGSGRIVPGYGFLLNNELSDFNPKPDQCNSIYQGRKQRASAVEITSKGEKASETYGTKRPRSSMTPLVVFDKGKPILLLGGSGGWTIINSVYQAFTNIVDAGMSLEAAIQKPRVFIKGDGKVYSEEEITWPTAVNGIDLRNNKAYADPRKNGFALLLP